MYLGKIRNICMVFSVGTFRGLYRRRVRTFFTFKTVFSILEDILIGNCINGVKMASMSYINQFSSCLKCLKRRSEANQISKVNTKESLGHKYLKTLSKLQINSLKSRFATISLYMANY